jgi:hypothetical protein
VILARDHDIDENLPLVHVGAPPAEADSPRLLAVNPRGLAALREALRTADETGDDVAIPVYENGQWQTLHIVHGCQMQFGCDGLPR